MLRIAIGVIVGILAWVLFWFGGERLLSAIAPASFGVHQRAFEAALSAGGRAPFTADPALLTSHIVLAVIVTLLAGFLAALASAGNQRAPVLLGCVLIKLGMLKALLSWPFVPVWYHLAFTMLLLPMAVAGGLLRRPRSPECQEPGWRRFRSN